MSSIVSANWSFDTLPSEITTIVLTNLPVKSILVCRSVCKTWCRIIDKPHFPQLHHQTSTTRAAAKSGNSSSSSYIFHTRPITQICIVTEEEDENKILHTVITSKFELLVSNNKHLGPYLQPPVCGLLCYYAKDFNDTVLEEDTCSMYICNPATRECIELPKFNPPQCSKQVFSSEFQSGFGFDMLSKDFKVVLILHSIKCWPSVPPQVQVYTLGSNSWRTIGEAPSSSIFYFSSAFVDGSLHWLARDLGRLDSLGKLIVSFDLGSEEFGVIRTPELVCRPDNVQLMAMGGSLSIVDPFFVDHIELWLMKEYGVVESWTKVSVSKVCLEGLTPKAISFEKYSEIKLLANSSELVSYNIDTGNFTSLEVDGLEPPEGSGLPKFFGAFSFVESLIALRSTHQREEQP